MAYDSFILGSEFEENEDFMNALKEYEELWFIGLEEDDEWKDAILQETPNIFTLGKNEKDVSKKSKNYIDDCK